MFSTPDVQSEEAEVIAQIDDLKRRLRFQVAEPKKWFGFLRKVALARAIRGSNSIEGYNVTLDDAIAAAGGDEPIEAEGDTWKAVVGYRRAMTYVLQIADDPHFKFGEDAIRGMHYMMIEHDLAKSPGRWRSGSIYVHDELKGQVVYEGPPGEDVPALMSEFVASQQAPDGAPSVVRAAMSHLNLVMIHPFRDGTGRMARAVQTLVLAREGIPTPEFCSIEEYLGRHTPEYYNVLAEVGAGSWHPERDARPWLRFCLTAHYRQANTLLRRIQEAGKRWELVEQEVQANHLPERTAIALFQALVGRRVRNSGYRTEADISDQLASRDLKLLVERGLLLAHGEKRGRYYVRSPRLQGIRDAAALPRDPEEDPFALAG